jgi:hypothetical protein
MPLTKEQAKTVTATGQKVVKAAGYASPANLAVKGGRAAASWALQKYRAYAKAKSDRAAKEAKAKAEKAADTYQPPTQDKPKKPAKPKPKEDYRKAGRDVRSAIEKNVQAKKDALNY